MTRDLFKNFQPTEQPDPAPSHSKESKSEESPKRKPEPDASETEAVQNPEKKETPSEEPSSSKDKSQKTDFTFRLNVGKNKDQKTDNDKEDPDNNKKPWDNNNTAMFVVFCFTAGYLLSKQYSNSLGISDIGSTEITLQEFITRYLDKGLVNKLIVYDRQRVQVYLKDGEHSFFFNIGSVDSFERQVYDAQYDAGLLPSQFVPIKYDIPANFDSTIKLIESLVFVGLAVSTYYAVKSFAKSAGGSKMFKVGKAGFTKVMPGEKGSVKFKDVAGCEEAKVEIMEFVSFLKDPDRFLKLGAKIPKGALLAGAPGTGKTLLAKATAGEANVPFFSISGSEFLEMFVGVGPARVRDLFAEARKHKPSIIWIDEIDAVGRAREAGKYGGGGSDERENTLNQLLVEMDGFSSESGVIVMAGTNRPDILDKALLRPGRFDRTITIEVPDIKGRKQIFMVHLAKLRTQNDKEEIATKVAALTPGFSGADIANICNEAALIAARKKKDYIQEVDFEKAIERVIGGLESNRHVLSVYEKKLVAFHEAGHAVAGWFSEHADPVLKVTIIPRSSGALGFAQYLPKESALMQHEQLSDKMVMIMGGRAAEQIFFGKISTGASNDIERATQMAFDIITKYGMGKVVPNLGFRSDNPYMKMYSEETAHAIDQEVKAIVKDSYDKVLALLEEKRALVEALALKLIEIETVNHEQIVSILGPRPFASDVYQDFLKNEHRALKSSDDFATAKSTTSQEGPEKASEGADKEKAAGNEGESGAQAQNDRSPPTSS